MPTDLPRIAVTFDDGPHSKNTMRVLDAAAERNIKLTFFVVGSRIANAPEVLIRQVAEGHEIGNHSWSHKSFANLSQREIEEEIARTNDAVWNTANVQPRLFRPPYGVVTKTQRAFIQKTFHQKVTLWNIDPLDWRKPGSNTITSRIATEIRPGAIVLLHDIFSETANTTPRIFDLLQKGGYNCVTVSELLQ